MLLWLRQKLLRLLKADYAKLDAVLHSADGERVRESVEQICGESPYLLLDDERPLVERSYSNAQRKHIGYNGYVLRFLVEYHVGKKQGRW